MGIGSIGSVSFWQQDQNNWNQAQVQAQTSAASDALITAMGNLMTNKVAGLASIANQEALDRVNAQLTAGLQSALQASQSASSPNASTTGAPAIGTGTVPLSPTTSLLTLGIPPNGTITVSDGTNETLYASTGSDTVSDLINAINNQNIATNAQVTASLNERGQLVLTGNNKAVPISVGGLFASDVGFGDKNDSFQPTAPTPSSSSSSATPSSSSSAASSTSSGAIVSQPCRRFHGHPVQFVLCTANQRYRRDAAGKQRRVAECVGLAIGRYSARARDRDVTDTPEHRTGTPMSIGSISFWQQNQNFRARWQSQSRSLANSTALIKVMANAVTTRGRGLASIANQTALKRVQTQLSAAIQSAAQVSAGGSVASSSSSSGSPATGTGTVPLTRGTSLLTLGIPPNGTITVSDGTNTTTYASTGTDTVADLINTINANVATNARVTASLDSHGKLVLSSRNKTDAVTVGGIFASDVGFGVANSTFQPTAPSPKASSSNSGSTTSSASTRAAASASSGVANNSANALKTNVTAEILLATSGSSGNLVNLLA